MPSSSRKSHEQFVEIPSTFFEARSRCSVRLYSGQNRKCLNNNLKKYPKQNVQLFRHVYRSRNGQNHVLEWNIQSFLSKRICTFRHWQDFDGNVNLKKIHWTSVGKEILNWECLFVIRARKLFSSVWVRFLTHKQDRRHRTFCEKWKTFIWTNQHYFLTMNILDCTQRKCKISRNILTNCKAVFESRISAWVKAKLLGESFWEIVMQKNILFSSYDMESHAKKRVERYCEHAY